MIADTRLVRRIGKRANQVEFGKQSNGTLFPVTMSPTKREQGLPLSDGDLRLKQSITIHYLLGLHFEPVACRKIGSLKVFFLKVAKRKRR